MQDSSRVTADMRFDMISPTRLMIVRRLHRAAGPCSVVVCTAASASNGPTRAEPRKQGQGGLRGAVGDGARAQMFQSCNTQRRGLAGGGPGGRAMAG